MRVDWAQVGPGWVGKIKEGCWVVIVAVWWAGAKSLEQVGGKGVSSCTSFLPKCGKRESRLKNQSGVKIKNGVRLQ